LARADHQPARAAQLHRRVPGRSGPMSACRFASFRSRAAQVRGCFQVLPLFSKVFGAERALPHVRNITVFAIYLPCKAYVGLQASSRFDHIYYHSAEFVRATASAAIPFRPKKIRNLPRTYQTCTKRSMTLRSKYHWLSLRRVRVRVRVRVNESMIERLALALVFWSGPPHL
jgi:hypothetical protein